MASPQGSKGNNTNADTPSSNPVGLDTSSTNSAASNADGQSKTSDGSQPLSAALGVTILVATTHAYIAPDDALSPRTQSMWGRGRSRCTPASAGHSATADAGNVKFSPDAPALPAPPRPAET